VNISDWILLLTALVAVFYAYETHKMRRAVASQLDTLRKTALLSAYASLFQIHIRVVEKESTDPLASQIAHYKIAILKAGENAQKIQQLVAELEKT